eukprot:1046501-Alexandrium_andersonii.AAC.1
MARRLIEAAGGDAARVADVRRLLARARTGDSPGEGEDEGRTREATAASPGERPGFPVAHGHDAPARAAEHGPGTTAAAGATGRHAPWVRLDTTSGPEPEGLPAGARSRSGSPGDAWPRLAARGRGGRGGAPVRYRLDEQAWDLGDV